MIRSTAMGSTEGAPPQKQYFGKYRGTVINNIDPKGEGRVQVIVPDIQVTPLLHWAVLAAPVAGIQNGMYAVPPIGSGVFVEFERGDIDYPICAASFWGSSAEIPRMGKAVQKPILSSLALQTPTQNGITISDMPAGDTGGIQIKTTFGAKISITTGQIKIDNGMGASIEMLGPTIKIKGLQVDINDGALTVI